MELCSLVGGLLLFLPMGVAGYRLLALSIFTSGFLVLTALTFLIFASTWTADEPEQRVGVAAIVSVAIGVAGGALALVFRRIGVCLVGALTGLLFGVYISVVALNVQTHEDYLGDRGLIIAIGALVAVLAGACTVRFLKPVVVGSSAFTGASGLVTAVVCLVADQCAFRLRPAHGPHTR